MKLAARDSWKNTQFVLLRCTCLSLPHSKWATFPVSSQWLRFSSGRSGELADKHCVSAVGSAALDWRLSLGLNRQGLASVYSTSADSKDKNIGVSSNCTLFSLRETHAFKPNVLAEIHLRTLVFPSDIVLGFNCQLFKPSTQGSI